MSAANNISVRSIKEADTENVAFRAAILYCHQRYNLKGSVDGDMGVSLELVQVKLCMVPCHSCYINGTWKSNNVGRG